MNLYIRVVSRALLAYSGSFLTLAVVGFAMFQKGPADSATTPGKRSEQLSNVSSLE
jgi:hypothetical protein